MKIKKLLSVTIVLFMLTAILPVSSMAGDNPFSGGDGTENDPYIITTAEQLAFLAERTNAGDSGFNAAHYKLGNDIDLSDYGAGFNNGRGWIPIGNFANRIFAGFFDGNGKAVTGLYINNTSLVLSGLFGFVTGNVKNLSVIDLDITGGSRVGGVAGSLGIDRRFNNSITNCYTSGSISGVDGVGGIVGGVGGYVVTAMIGVEGGLANCSSSATVTATGSGAGGIVGGISDVSPSGESPNWSIYIRNCYATGAVTGNQYVGGVVGQVGIGSWLNVYIDNCYATGAVIGNQFVGGVIGGEYAWASEVFPRTRAYNNNTALNPSVSGDLDVGRIMGNRERATFARNHALASMTHGGGIPFPTPAETYDVHNNLNGAGVSAEEALTAAFWVDTMRWDPDVWEIADGKLPTLKGLDWQTGEPPPHFAPHREPITSVRIDLSAISRVARGTTKTIDITVNQDANPEEAAKITLSTSNQAMATIGPDGRSVITQNRAGTVTLTATYTPENGATIRHSVTLMIT